MNIFLDLLPIILGTALAPAWLIIVLLILQSHNGLVKATAFVIGTSIVRLLQGIIFGYLFINSPAVEGDANDPAPLVSTLLMVVGLLLLMSALKKLLHEPDPDAPPPKWINRIESSTPLQLLIMGVILTLIAPKLWIFTLSAIGIIVEAHSSSAQSLTLFLLYLLVSELLLVLPLLVCTIIPDQSASQLRAASDWLNRHNSQITLAVSLIFGCLFFWKGVTGLL
ncbi:MAG: GAP family protein [Pegethrix bostrychoides GSE-TBD4-15B]|jgi:threonine/homoserine/homoserine lactone efflux protein|uniref:GAP family protein n=1 Tax=Pegethrix bostrychoides GSE-TBD4-15B TaxID=2839662 RepID=A0A951U8Q3_9CYAN|nr:GAP family protein [Pegethrix bostrychoides GSE-TBD4-15B]